MTIKPTRKRLDVSSFARDTGGATAVLFAFMAMLLVIVSGAAIDFSCAHSDRRTMQFAADSASLAAATVTSTDPEVRKAVGESYFKANLGDVPYVNVSVKSVDGKVNVVATKDYQTQILSIVGFNNIPIEVRSGVPIPKHGFAEVVLVLDYSDSMLDNDKYVRLKEAAHKMIDVLSDDGKKTNIKFGIVPFAALVHADLPAGYIRSDVVYDGCTQDRRYPANTEEAAGYSDASKWGEITSTHTCGSMALRDLKVVPLDSDVDLVKSKLDAMEPFLWTNISAGADFGWQVLSPTGPFADGTPYSNKSTVKVFVLLTDGMQTAPGWGPGDIQSVPNGEDSLLAICEGMKQRDIKVYTVGYDLTDAHTLQLLEDCADTGSFYDAKDISSGLLASFSSIATKVQTAMLRLAE